jgi:sterol desaturase/sphingolipid hydroxylase (fatty acid hydroxylase superfamily)
MLLVFGVFLGLTIATFWGRSGWQQLRQRDRPSWILDLVGLFVQGFVIPILQVVAIGKLSASVLPGWQGTIGLSPVLGFLLNFVAIDYLYYWNHRLLHGKALWPVHQVHHSVTVMDVLGTSRNTLWSSFLIVYLWLNGLFVYLLDDPTWYLLGMSVTSALDLWRHSRFEVAAGSGLDRVLSPWLMLPQDHRWHHGSAVLGCNFGANLKVWDRLHGTDFESEGAPETLGGTIDLSLVRQLIFPYLPTTILLGGRLPDRHLSKTRY